MFEISLQFLHFVYPIPLHVASTTVPSAKLCPNAKIMSVLSPQFFTVHCVYPIVVQVAFTGVPHVCPLAAPTSSTVPHILQYCVAGVVHVALSLSSQLWSHTFPEMVSVHPLFVHCPFTKLCPIAISSNSLIPQVLHTLYRPSVHVGYSSSSS